MARLRRDELMVAQQMVERRVLVRQVARQLGPVTGTSCETEWEELARTDLVLQAGRKGADAVARVGCRKRGLSLASGCLSRMVCEGDAVVWM